MTVTPLHRLQPPARPARVVTMTTLARDARRHAATARAVWRHPAARTARRVASLPVWAVVGAARAVGWVYAWVMHGGSGEFVAAARANPAEGTDAWLRLRADARIGRAQRWRVTWITAAVTVVTLAVMWWLARGLAVTLLVTGTLALAWYGWTWRHKPADLMPEGIIPTFGRDDTGVTYDVIVDALASLGIGRLTKAIGQRGPAAIRWDGPIARDANNRGTVVRLELPGGVTARMIVAKQEELAGALGRSPSTVEVGGDPKRSAGFVEVYVADEELFEAPMPTVPVLADDTARVDYFRPFVVGIAPRGEWVTLKMEERNILAGGEPGSGKTGGISVPVFTLAQDPTVRFWVHELKGSGDLEAVELFAERYTCGAGEDSIQETLDSCEQLYLEVKRRAEAFRDLPRELRPHYKVTREIADKWPDVFGPLVFAIDEVQVLLGHAEHGKAATRFLVEASRLTRFSATSLILATQRPASDTIDTALRSNMHVRMAFKSDTQNMSRMILGDSAGERGARADKLIEGQPGVGWCLGSKSHPGPVKVRLPYFDAEDRHALAERGRQLRVEAGLLRGLAAGIDWRVPAEDRVPPRDTLADVVACTRRHARTGIFTTTLLAALRAEWPEHYADWQEDNLADALRFYKAGPQKVWDDDPESGESASRRGYHLATLRAAFAARDEGATA